MKSTANPHSHKGTILPIDVRIERLNTDYFKSHTLPFESLLKQCFPTLSAEIFQNFCSQWTTQRLQQITENGCVMIASTDSETVGFLICSAPEGGVGTLFWLMIDPAWQGNGIGSELLRRMDTFYTEQNCHKIKLTAPTEHARDYYLHKGFNQEGFHPNHWWNLDFWLLAKFI